MPVWLEILFGAVPGTLGLLVAVFHMGGLRHDVHDLVERAKGWDQAKQDLSYIKGRFDGTQATVDLLQEQAVAPHTARRRPRPKLVSGS